MRMFLVFLFKGEVGDANVFFFENKMKNHAEILHVVFTLKKT